MAGNHEVEALKMIKIREYRRYYLDGNETVTYVMYVNGEKVGYAYVTEFLKGKEDNESDGMDAYIDRIDIYDGYRNKGFGSTFIAWISGQYDRVFAAPDNLDSQRLFDRIGREHYGEYGGFDQGFGVYEIRWVGSQTAGIEFYVDHAPEPEPESEPDISVLDPLGRRKTQG